MRIAEVRAALDTVDQHGVLTAYVWEQPRRDGKTTYNLFSSRGDFRGRIHPRYARQLIAHGSLVATDTNEHGHTIYQPYREYTPELDEGIE